MRKAFLIAASAILAAGAPPIAQAASGRFYLGADFGVAGAQSLASTRINVGVPTNCDQWLAGATLNDGARVPLPLSQCQPRALPASPNRFGLDAGWLLGIAAGRAFGQFRVEAEYFHRRHGGERLPLVVPGDPKQAEFAERSEEIDDLGGGNFFANLHYGLGSPGSGKLKPYIGAGLGLMRSKLRYSATSIRNSSRQALLDLGRNPNAAGLVSRADDKLTDNLLGFQFIAGLDYALSRRQALTVKLRYANAFGAFADHDKQWQPLRGHESTVGPGGAPIRYGVEARDLGFWSLSLGFRFFAD